MKMMSLALMLNVAFASYPTDLALLKQAVAGALAAFALPPDANRIAVTGATGTVTGATGTVTGEGMTDENALVRDALYEKYGRPGFEIFSGPPPDTGSYALAIHVTEAAVYHQRRFKKLPWSPNYIQRRARVEFELTLAKNGRVIETKSLGREATAVVNERDLPLVRSRQFTHEETLVDSPNLWEPLLVALVVGALVVAFYGPKSF